MSLPRRSLVLLLSTAVIAHAAAKDDPLNQWPAWRGPLATGVAPRADPPVLWSETNNIRWKVEISGKGTASPVVWNDQVFILTAIPTGKKVDDLAASPTSSAPASGGSTGAMVEKSSEEQRFTVISYDRATGKERWRQSPVALVPHEGHHKDHGYASASPVTDGEVLIASFGSRGIFVYNLAGKLLWEKQLGRMVTRNGFGEGSSPALHGDVVVIVWDHDGPEDFVVALDKRTGRELWRQKREEDTNWSTPLIVEHEGRTQVVVHGGVRVRSYDLKTGEEIWQVGGQTKNAVPAPVPGHGRVYVTSGWRGAALQAITLGRKGDLTGTDAVAWSHNKSTPYIPSPLLYDDWLYFYSNTNPQLSIFNAKEGRSYLDAERLEGVFSVYASPVGAAGRVYLTTRDGVVLVIKNGPKLEILGRNRLDDGFDASPAVVGRELFLRGRKSLYSITESGLAAR